MIEIKNISKTYRMGRVKVYALKEVSLRIDPGEFIAIMGPSGSGKSTLLHILGFLDKPDSGEYWLDGNDVTGLKDAGLALLRNKLVGFVFQQFHLLSRNTAVENVGLPLIYAGRGRMKEKAIEKIREVELEERSFHRPSELSGGEQQRVAIARALVNEPLIIFADEPTGNLDSKSQEEILTILAKLNGTGKTIIMVTHEEGVARYAKRIIRMLDGRIVSDDKNSVDISSFGESREKIDLKGILSASHSTFGKAEFLDHIAQAFHSIIRNKMRSLLSMLGILIGVASVIAMLALGQGAKEAIAQRLASLGSNLLVLRPGSPKVRGVALAPGVATRFNFGDVSAIARMTDLVNRVSPQVRGGGQIVYGDKNWSTQISGIGIKYLAMRASTPESGRNFTEEELRRREKVILLGTTVARELFGDDDPVGKTVKLNRINFQVIGVLPEKGGSHWRDRDDVVMVPITTAMYRVLGKNYIDSISVEVRDAGMMKEAENGIRELIIKRHRLSKKREDSFRIRNLSEIQEALESTTKTMSTLLGFIAAISLLVGGVGIMNIMLVSVTERTREIGLRKAIGARSKDIMAQFLIESVAMTFTGGMIGILVGVGSAVMLSVVAGWATRVSMYSIVLASIFSVLVGVCFGFWPARQAARLNPIEALRYE